MQNYIKDNRRFNFTMVENELLENEDLGTYEKLLYITLCKFAGQENTCFPSRKTLAKLVSCSVKTIDNKLKSLIDKGLISKQERRNEKGEHTSNLYIIKGVAKQIRQGGETDSPRGETDSPELYSLNNITSNNKIEEEDAREKKVPEKISTKFEQVFNRKLSAKFYQKLIKIYSDPQILMKALLVAEEKADKPGWLIETLKNWKEEKLKSIKSIDRHLEKENWKDKKKYIRSRTKNSKKSKKETKRKEMHEFEKLQERGWNQ